MKHVFYAPSFDVRSVEAVNPNLYRYIASLEADDIFRVMNVVEEGDLPLQLRCRSMSVGDVYVENNEAFLCASCGWKKLTPVLGALFVALLPERLRLCMMMSTGSGEYYVVSERPVTV